jgi:phospholipase/carboxylesterase
MLQTDLIVAKDANSKDLLIALHGLGDSMEGYRWVPEMLQMPRVNVLLVNAPDPYYGGYSWYDFAADPAPGVERSYRLIETLLEDLFQKGYVPERTVLFGFSQGCLMCFETGLRYAKRLAGLIGVSGYVHEPARLLKMRANVAKDQRFLITHGSRDALIPSRLVQPQIEQLRAAGMQIEFHEFDKDHTVIEPELRLIRNWLTERWK